MLATSLGLSRPAKTRPANIGELSRGHTPPPFPVPLFYLSTHLIPPFSHMLFPSPTLLSLILSPFYSPLAPSHSANPARELGEAPAGLDSARPPSAFGSTEAKTGHMALG